MEYAICTVAAAPVRKEDSHRSEMVNQLLFGETMSLLEQKGEWLRVRTLYDDYEGWLTQHLVTPVTETVALAEPFYVASSLVNPVTLPDQLINLPMGSFLTGYDEETRLLWDPDYKYHGTFRDIRKPFASDLLRKTIHAWINAPYLWGGKTFMGVDCSGFVQTVFKLLGKKLPRDAYQQALTGTAISNLGETQKRLLLATGFCGGFTTFSAFTQESMQLLMENRWLVFSLYVGLSITAGLLATYLGYKLIH